MSRGEQPNILVFVTDQHRYDWLGSTSDIPVRTPTIDRLAGRGLRFDEVLCPSPLCAPSRACLASGYRYDRAGVPHNSADFDTDRTTYYQLLRDEGGYHVAGCGKFDLHKSTPDWGLDGQRCLSEWGFSAGIDNAGKWDAVISGAETPTDPYMAYLHEDGLAEAHVADMRRRRDEGAFRATFPTPLPEDSYCDNWIARNGLSLLADAPPDRPWHLVVNFAGPHDPMDVTERMHDWYRTPDVEFPSPTNRGDRLSIEEHAAVRRNYSAMIENVDRWVGRYLETLERRGELHNTVVVFTSDHGEMLGDQGEWRKRSPYHPSVAVPLVVAGPGVASQRPSDALVNVYDLFATLLDIADVDVPDGVDSRSFADVLQGDTDTHRPVLRTALGDWEAVYDGTYKLVSGYAPLCENGERTLVTPERDETVDVSDAAPDVRARLTDVIDRDPLVSSPTA